MERTIKMIALDMDGTTLNDEKKITPYTKQVLKAAIDAGVVVLVATGRPASAVPKEFTQIEGVRYIISANGARVVDQIENKVLFEKLISPEESLTILKVIEDLNVYKEVFFEGVGYSIEGSLADLGKYNMPEYMGRYFRESRHFVASLEDEIKRRNQDTDKIQMIFADQKERQEAIEKITAIAPYELSGALDNNIELTQVGINKGTSLLRLGRELGISREEIMAIGDGMNDASMLQEAGLGIAMENALDSLKVLADHVTDTNNKDGVAKAIEKYVELEKRDALC